MCLFFSNQKSGTTGPLFLAVDKPSYAPLALAVSFLSFSQGSTAIKYKSQKTQPSSKVLNMQRVY